MSLSLMPPNALVGLITFGKMVRSLNNMCVLDDEIHVHTFLLGVRPCAFICHNSRVFVRAGTQGPLLAYYRLHPSYFYTAYKRVRAHLPCGPC